MVFSSVVHGPLGVPGQLQRKWGLICENSLGVYRFKGMGEKYCSRATSLSLGLSKCLRCFSWKELEASSRGRHTGCLGGHTNGQAAWQPSERKSYFCFWKQHNFSVSPWILSSLCLYCVDFLYLFRAALLYYNPPPKKRPHSCFLMYKRRN